MLGLEGHRSAEIKSGGSENRVTWTVAFDGLTDVLLVFGVDAPAVMDGDGTVPVEVGVETDVPGAGSEDGVLFMFWKPPSGQLV